MLVVAILSRYNQVTKAKRYYCSCCCTSTKSAVLHINCVTRYDITGTTAVQLHYTSSICISVVGKIRLDMTTMFLFFPSHLLSSPLRSCSLVVVTQIRSHITGSSPPSPLLRYVPIIFIPRRIQHFLPSSARVELCLLTQ